jgi:hypothetical protein
MNFKPKSGDHVEVVLRGKVTNAYGGSWFTLEGSGLTDIAMEGDEVVSIKEVLPPEQKWLSGDIVLDVRNVPYEYSAIGNEVERWWQMASDRRVALSYPKRPLRLIHRDGNPVSE